MHKSLLSVFKTLLFLILSVFYGHSQDSERILEDYKNHTNISREIAYAHLNKSTYIKGESIGFTAYLFDKESKIPNSQSTNLYVSIEDENGKVIKQKLLMLKEGVVSNVFDVDTLFNSGHYTFKAYTNHMRNFNQQNYFLERIRVIDPKTETTIVTEKVENQIDAQFLPESGHLLQGTLNRVGAIFKDKNGYGIPNIKGQVLDTKNNIVSTFKANHLGIGSFMLHPQAQEQYKVRIDYLNKEHFFTINTKTQKIGVNIAVNTLRDKAIIALKTNIESLEVIKDKPYLLSIHNGSKIKTYDINFNNELELVKALDLNALTSGVNIVTLFNENNQPVAERMFFNHLGLDIIASDNIIAKAKKDSVEIKLSFKSINTDTSNNISISVLPTDTESYKRHHNMLSYIFLQPYINGNIEDAKYYFTANDQKRKLDLDNLLLTQGWSSYNWEHIFSEKQDLSFEFEKGIKLKANTNGEASSLISTYMSYLESSKEPSFFEIQYTDVDHFYIDNLFPVESDGFYLTKFKNEKAYPPNLYIQAIPSDIPTFYVSNTSLRPKAYYELETTLKNNTLSPEGLDKVQELEEVVVESELTREERRINELAKNTWGDIDIIDEREIKKYQYLSNYLNTNGFRAFENHRFGRLAVSNKNSTRFNPKPPPLLYLNGFPADSRDLYLLLLNDIEYISIDRMSRGSGKYLGIIRVHLYPGNRREDNRIKKQKFTFPLTFAPDKKFYVPKYQYYNDDFYKQFGTVDWKPQLIADDKGNVRFKIATPEVPVTLFIEGITNSGRFISEEKSISLN